MTTLPETLSRPGATLRYADSGDSGTSADSGTAVVFTHGAGVDNAMFDIQYEAVRAAGYRAVTWDLRGHGHSALDAGTRFRAQDALDDLAALIARLRLKSPLLIGHSLGGNLVQEFVRRNPILASGLVVIDSTWNAGPLTGLERFGLRIAAPALAMIPAARLPRLMATASASTPGAIDYAQDCFARMTKPVFLDVWRATLSLVDPTPGYRSPVPLTLIRGADDRTGNIRAAMPQWATAEKIVENVIPGAGHIVTLDAPDAVSEIILTALG